QRFEAAQVGSRGIATRHRAEHAVVTGLQWHVQVACQYGCLAQCRDELVVDVIDLDRREPQSCEIRNRSRLAEKASERVPGLAVPVAAQVDPGQHYLAMPLVDPAPDLGEHRPRGPAARGAAYKRDDAEVAGEAAAVLHLDEG